MLFAAWLFSYPDFSFDDVLTIVPTLQEAYDYIEMDEMARQLEL